MMIWIKRALGSISIISPSPLGKNHPPSPLKAQAHLVKITLKPISSHRLLLYRLAACHSPCRRRQGAPAQCCWWGSLPPFPEGRDPLTCLHRPRTRARLIFEFGVSAGDGRVRLREQFFLPRNASSENDRRSHREQWQIGWKQRRRSTAGAAEKETTIGATPSWTYERLLVQLVDDLVLEFPSSFERSVGVDVGETQRCERVHLPARQRWRRRGHRHGDMRIQRVGREIRMGASGKAEMATSNWTFATW